MIATTTPISLYSPYSSQHEHIPSGVTPVSKKGQGSSSEEYDRGGIKRKGAIIVTQQDDSFRNHNSSSTLTTINITSTMTAVPEFAYGSGPPKPVPPQKPEEIAEGITLLRPLSRKGHGPGLIILAPPPPSPQDNNNPTTSSKEIQNGIPSLRMKWAEEGYCVAQIQSHASSSSSASSSSALQIAVQALQACAECEPKEKMGIICYDFDLWLSVTAASTAAALPEQIVVAAIYAHISQYQHLVSSHHHPPSADGSSGGGKSVLPTIYHLAGTTSSSSATTPAPPKAAAAAASPNSKIYEYPSMETSSFAVPFCKEFDYATEAVSHSRNLAFVKKVMGGPYFDLELLWEEHTFYEFGSRSVENTMATMVEEPYVNHVPTVRFFFSFRSF